MWFSKIATPEAIGRPLWPPPKQKDGSCGRSDKDGWAKFAGDPDYNIKNPCCRVSNQGSWGNLITTVQAQETMAYLFSAKGRQHYANFMGKLAKAVDGFPAALGIELMNEPPALQRDAMYETWQVCYEAIRGNSSTLAVVRQPPV